MELNNDNRNLDHTTTSMTVVQLNDMIASMRPLMKRAKVQVIHKLTDQIKTYKQKRGSDLQKLANNKKVERLLQELNMVKKAELDRVIKFSLSNTETVQSPSIQDSLLHKVKVRLSTQKLIQERVFTWRQKHEDWKSLAAFSQQHVSRRLKKKSKKKRLGEETVYLDSSQSDESSDEDSGVNSNETQDKNNAGDDSDKKVSMDESKSIETKFKKTVKSIKLKPTENLANTQNISEKDFPMVELTPVHGKFNKKLSSKRTEISESSISTSDESNSELQKHKINSLEVKQFSCNLHERTGTAEVESDISDDVESEKKIKTVKRLGPSERDEVVVKRINLNMLGDADDVIKLPDKNISFLFKTTNTLTVSKKSSITASDNTMTEAPREEKRIKDMFFLTGSNSDQESQEDFHNKIEADGFSSDTSEDELEQAMFKKAKKRMMVESTFVGSLNQAKHKKPNKSSNKSNKAWSQSSKSNTYRGSDHSSLGKYSKPIGKQTSKDGIKPSGHNPEHRKTSQNISVIKGAPNKMPLNIKSSSKQQVKRTNTVEKLHPSWEASKKRKLEQTTMRPFQGKKTVFDD